MVIFPSAELLGLACRPYGLLFSGGGEPAVHKTTPEVRQPYSPDERKPGKDTFQVPTQYPRSCTHFCTLPGAVVALLGNQGHEEFITGCVLDQFDGLPKANRGRDLDCTPLSCRRPADDTLNQFRWTEKASVKGVIRRVFGKFYLFY